MSKKIFITGKSTGFGLENKIFTILFRKINIAIIFFAAIIFSGNSNAQNIQSIKKKDLTDEALVKQLPGFKNGYATVNGIKLHYVAGGQGELLILLPGWPETWWTYHKMMPELAKKYKVVSVDLRGMGTSDKPLTGYDKKTMAKDIYELVHQLGYEKAAVAGHDIGSNVAFSYAANHPDGTSKLIMLDVPHPEQGLMSIPLLPVKGTFGDKLDEMHPYLWWFAFHQVKGLPEKLLEGRVHLLQEWFFKYLLVDESAVSTFDRAIYANAYDKPDAIRAGNAWYQGFPQDIEDDATYSKLQMPVLALAGPGYNWMKAVLETKTTNLKIYKVEGSGHFLQEEKPEALLSYINDFLK